MSNYSADLCNCQGILLVSTRFGNSTFESAVEKLRNRRFISSSFWPQRRLEQWEQSEVCVGRCAKVCLRQLSKNAALDEYWISWTQERRDRDCFWLESRLDFSSRERARFCAHNWMRDACGEFVVGSAVQAAAGLGFADASPLFEEKSDFAFAALISQRENPVFANGSGPWSTFPADDHPVDAAQVQLTNVFQKRLNGEETNPGTCCLKTGDAGDAIFFVLDADTPPDVWLLRGKAQLRIEKNAEALGALC